MKFLIVLALCVACTLGDHLTEEQKKKMTAYKEECMKTWSVDADMVKHAKEGHVDPADEKLGNFLFCMYQKMGFMDDKGMVLVDNIMKKIPSTIPQEKATEVVNKCKEMTADTPWQKSLLVFKCYMENKTWDFPTEH